MVTIPSQTADYIATAVNSLLSEVVAVACLESVRQPRLNLRSQVAHKGSYAPFARRVGPA